MIVYVDVILLENICMNFIILFATSYIMKVKTKIYRIFIASLIGAIYAVLVYLDIIEIYTSIFMKIILSICMVYIAYKPKILKGMIKELVVFYLVSFSLGGCAFALLYIVKPQEVLIKNGVYVGIYPIKIALLGGIVGFVVTYIAFKIVKNKISKNEIIYTVEIKIGDNYEITNMLLDTGNMLKDPITNSPVVLVERKVLEKLLPKSLIEVMVKENGGDLNGDIGEYRNRIRIIPFSSVGKQNGIMIGIKIDEIKVLTDIDEVINKDAILCVYNRNFSKNKKYSGLLGIDLLERRSENEHFTNAKK